MGTAALDIGGTAIKSGIWTGIKDEIKEVRETPTNARLGGAHVVEQAVKILESYHGFDAIGISTAGQVDSQRGMIRYANENIPGYTGMEIGRMLRERFHVPVAVENDVNAAALGEGIFGAGRGERDFLCLTYGTGVGGAIVMDQKVYHGCAFSAGEFGGLLIHPEDRKEGEFSAAAMRNTLQPQHLQPEPWSLIQRLQTGGRYLRLSTSRGCRRLWMSGSMRL